MHSFLRHFFPLNYYFDNSSNIIFISDLNTNYFQVINKEKKKISKKNNQSNQVFN
jgi:hypothetical protein